jgi:hypothetical protein
MRRWVIAPVLAVLILPTMACEDLLFDDPEHVYSGPPMVEFAPVVPSGSYTRTVTLGATATSNTMTTVRVNYIAAPPSSAVNGQIIREGTSTAVEGEHYRFASGSGAYTIAAGTNFADVQIEVLADGFDAGESVTLVLELADAESFEVSENYKLFTLTLRKSS